MNDNENKNTDKVADIRARLAAVTDKAVPPTEPAPMGVSDGQPSEDMWEITCKERDAETGEPDRVLAYGFYSFNPLGVVIARTQDDGTHLVETIVPWDNVAYMERVHMDDEDATTEDAD